MFLPPGSGGAGLGVALFGKALSRIAGPEESAIRQLDRAQAVEMALATEPRPDALGFHADLVCKLLGGQAALAG